ncbi:MAG: transposase [Deltaproteobacteria bacterium]|nr:transposase [Deltaproteobacteria bacterium]
MSSLVCLGRHTVTGLLTTSGRQFHDWSADYRIFCRERFHLDQLFDPIRRGILDQLPTHEPLVVAMDDSLFYKTGKKTPGVAYRRDPLGPPFRVNFILGQRFLQISAALPTGQGPAAARMIPLNFRHCPTPQKPRRLASEEEWGKYHQAKKKANISQKGVERLHALRAALNNDPGGKDRTLVAVVDGGYTNSTVLKNLPAQTVLIGRIRKDAKLYHPPEPPTQNDRGRRRSYGQPLPTPEELRQDHSLPYQPIIAWATGKHHTFMVKSIPIVKWRTAGEHRSLRLIIIAPLAYRLTKKSRLLYRKPAYLICTDPEMPPSKILQSYLWRWDIEVNLRDEKHILGAGQAQVRHQHSVEKVPALIIAAYAMLLLAARQAFGTSETISQALPKPKWRENKKPQRASTQDLINHLRAELWGKSMGVKNFSRFKDINRVNPNPQKWKPQLTSAVLYTCT